MMNIQNTALIIFAACSLSSMSLVCSFDPAQKDTPSTITLSLVEGNIVTQKFNDPTHAALVNAANGKLAAGAGVCGAIFRAAGYKALTNACNEHKNGCPLGNARTTNSCAIKYAGGAHYIIHAVGPQTVNKQALINAYHNSLVQADKHKLTAIAFPAISTGIFGYDVEDATPVALAAITNYIKNNPKTTLRDIRLVTFRQSHKRMLQHKPEDYWIYARNLQKHVKNNVIKPATSHDAQILAELEKSENQSLKPVITCEILVQKHVISRWINRVKKLFWLQKLRILNH